MKLTTIAFRNISRNRRRSLLSVTAIAVAALAITCLFSIIEGMRADISYNLQTFYTGQIRIRNAEYDRHETLNPIHLSVAGLDDVIKRVESTEGVSMVVPRITFPGAIFLGDDTFRAMGIGVDFERERTFQQVDDRLVSGRLANAGANEAVVGTRLAAELGLGLGERFTVLTTTATRGSNAMTFEIVGLIDFPVAALSATQFLAPIDRVQHLVRMHDAASVVLAKLDRGVTESAVARNIANELSATAHDDLSVIAWTDISQSYSLVETASRIYNVIALFFFVLGSTVIINTTMMVVFERMREIGTLAAMGMRGDELVKLFFLEGLYLAIAGALAGVLAGVAVSAVLATVGINFGAAMGDVDMEISNVLYPVINLRSTVFVFIYSVVVASAAAVLPARRAARISPVEALRAV